MRQGIIITDMDTDTTVMGMGMGTAMGIVEQE
jgi:hypothetical protein